MEAAEINVAVIVAGSAHVLSRPRFDSGRDGATSAWMSGNMEKRVDDFQHVRTAVPDGRRVRWISVAARRGEEVKKMPKDMMCALKVEAGS